MTSLRSNDNLASGGNDKSASDPADKRNHRIDDVRGGFVLKARSDEAPARRNSLVEKTKKGLLSVSGEWSLEIWNFPAGSKLDRNLS